MKRILPDTNFYGLLAKDPERLEVVGSIKVKREWVMYGFKIIRNELRDVPKKIRVEGRSLRIDLLNLYDEVAGGHNLGTTDKIAKIAEDYYKAYREFGGSKSKDLVINDFKIVSCASLHNLDIVVSNDEKSMSTENALRAYRLVNSVLRINTPRFIDYGAFKRILRGEPDEFV